MRNVDCFDNTIYFAYTLRYSAVNLTSDSESFIPRLTR